VPEIPVELCWLVTAKAGHVLQNNDIAAKTMARRFLFLMFNTIYHP
jgi:hypothetical protein